MNRLKFIIAFLSVLLLLTIDRLTKFLIIKSPDQGFFLIEKKYFTFGFKFLGNKNLAFSIPLPQIFIIVCVIIIVIYLIYLLYNYCLEKKYLDCLFLLMVICGALSNLFDRLYFGYVIDFINAYFGFFKFAVFNIADAMIVAGIACLIIKELFKKRSLKKAVV